VVTSEYDRFDRTSERLDVLGVVRIEEGHGRLVVIELKRDGTSTTVDLQAIKYAAYVAACQFSDVVEMYAAYHDVAADDARERLLELLGGTEDEPPLVDNTPRIVLVAADFRPEVTTTVLWLVDNFENMDIRCVRLQPFEIGDKIVISTDVIIPLPEAEQYRLGVQRKRRELEREQQQTARAGRLIPRLFEAGAIEVGQKLWFRRDAVPEGADPPWTKDEPLYSATIATSEGIRTLRWRDAETGEDHMDSPSLHASRILHRLGLRTGELSSAGVNGMHYWTVDGEISLRDLGAETGVLERGNSHIDRAALKRLCGSIPAGRWTTYGDLATAVGATGAAQSVAGIIATDPDIQNAHHVLRAGGRISPGWLSTDGTKGPEHARQRLEDEGITFDDTGSANREAYWKPPTLAERAHP
jgi:alkylated DNA nucleotide flippase Atl1